METLTNAQWYSEFQRRYRLSDNPDVDEAEFSDLANQSILRWMSGRHKEGMDRDEAARANLGWATYERSGAGATVDLEPGEQWVLGLSATIAGRVVPVTPTGADRKTTGLIDPFNDPTDRWPDYTEKKGTANLRRLSIRSTTAPSAWTLTTLNLPAAIDVVTKPGDWPPFSRVVQDELLEGILGLAAIVAQDAFRYQAQAAEQLKT